MAQHISELTVLLLLLRGKKGRKCQLLLMHWFSLLHMFIHWLWNPQRGILIKCIAVLCKIIHIYTWGRCQAFMWWHCGRVVTLHCQTTPRWCSSSLWQGSESSTGCLTAPGAFDCLCTFSLFKRKRNRKYTTDIEDRKGILEHVWLISEAKVLKGERKLLCWH